MNALDPGREWLRISEHYRQLSDSELLVLGRQQAELTDFAQQALAHELSQRGLKVESDVEKEEPPPIPMAPSDPSYDEERRLVMICTVWSPRDALQVQTLLDRAGIPFFMGPERATGADAVTSNYANGVGVAIMNIGVPWARQTLGNYAPADAPPEKPEEEAGEIQVRCPKCHSEEVVFERLIGDWTSPVPATAEISAPIYKWTCDSCGHQWEDDGLIEEE
jgi:DNA-directed RNA polymerase subunit M/transcription elongation factor TFIIS